MSGPKLGERVVEFRSFYEQTKQDDSLLNHMILLDITSILDEIRETRIFFKKPRKTARTPKSHPKHPKMSKKKTPQSQLLSHTQHTESIQIHSCIFFSSSLEYNYGPNYLGVKLTAFFTRFTTHI